MEVYAQDKPHPLPRMRCTHILAHMDSRGAARPWLCPRFVALCLCPLRGHGAPVGSACCRIGRRLAMMMMMIDDDCYIAMGICFAEALNCPEQPDGGGTIK